MGDDTFEPHDYDTQELLELLDRTMDKIPLEDKMVEMHTCELFYLEPWEIQDITQEALSNLPEGLEDQVDLIFDVIYDAVSEALQRAKRQMV